MSRKFITSLLAVVSVASLAWFSTAGKNGRKILTNTSTDKLPLIVAPEFSQALVTDTPPEGSQINLQYPIYDHLTDFLTTPDNNSLDLVTPSNIQQNVEYDPESNQYIISETIGDQFYRDPSYMSFEDFLKYEYDEQEKLYWSQRSNASSLLERKGIIPEVDVKSNLVNRIFRGTTVDIRPQGNIDLTFGGNYQNILNPTLTKKQRQQGGFQFDMNINMNVIGKIGEALKLTTSYNTQATFDFENQVKLDYTGDDDWIIKKIEAGNVSLPLSTSLIQGNQSLFGLKTQLQFGRLTVTNVISQQQSQSQNILIQGGTQTQTFSISADEYDEYRNFFLAHYFRNNFKKALSTLPIITSAITINKIEVWVTNKTGATVDTRNIVAFMDLGEPHPYSPSIDSFISPTPELPYASNVYPQYNVNNLYPNLTLAANSGARSVDQTVQTLTGPVFNLVPVQDFEKTYARKLQPSEYSFNPQLGMLLMNQQLNSDDVLAVAYQYTYNGRVYQVGEFAEDVPPSVDTPKVLFLKLMKSTSTRPQLPIWDLMMKNIYSLGAYQVSNEDFFLDIYYQDPGGGEKRYLPVASLSGIPLIRVLGLDRLNNNNDLQPDGVFDFVPGITINPSNGKVIFPELEPFGSDLAAQFPSANVAQPYIYQVLYDSTKTVALQYPEFNRYKIKGTYKSSVSSEISLGAFQIPPNSVHVTAGGQTLVENTDYTVDYNLGRVRILNQSILNSGVPINVSYESSDLFSFQTKTLIGTRLDYYINDKFSLGGTWLHLSERPYTPKLNVGDDPISNSIYGLDASFNSPSEWLTKMVDKIPLIDTKEESNITLSGEVAALQPGHSSAIGKQGTVYIDDFEGTQTSYDLKFPFQSWSLASTPQGSVIPDGDLINEWKYGWRRAKLSWYNIDPFFYTNSAPDGIKDNHEQLYNFYSRQIFEGEIFNKDFGGNGGVPQNTTTFDLRFHPEFRGPYNFDTTDLQYDQDSKKIQFPYAERESKWGGIQRSIDQSDFEEANVEYIQLWVLDPFLNNTPDLNNSGGQLYIDLGSISEDVLRDSRFFYENGLSASGDTGANDHSVWSQVPPLPPLNTAFDFDPNSRQNQDVGYDGCRTDYEDDFYEDYLQGLGHGFNNNNSSVIGVANADPSNDNYKYFDDPTYTDVKAGILERYEDYNGPDGNSPISSTNQNVSFAATNQPNTEDLNHDNTVNETEEYFEYKINITQSAFSVTGQNFVTDIKDTPIVDNNGVELGHERFIQLKIPINDYQKRVGNIQDFKSIRFIRMYLTGFDTTVILRFARMELVRNQWRKYNLSLSAPGEYIPNDNSPNTIFNVGSVSVEENSKRWPVNYVLPPGIEQEIQYNNTYNTLQNEQALSLQVCNLQDGDARAVYKALNLDLRTYDTLKMFVHAESGDCSDPLNSGDITAFIRLGSDFVSNYYEYEKPLVPTTYDCGNLLTSISDRNKVWPDANNFEIVISELTAAKQQRNNTGVPVTQPYIVYLASGAKITIVGNPDLGIAAVCMLGVRNPKATPGGDDDGKPKCAEVWFNELRLSGFDEQGGFAALARAEFHLADFGTVAMSGTMHTIGYGQLEQKLDERYKDNFFQYDVSGTFELGKFLPKNVGLKLPMFIGKSENISNPQYDPYDHDILLVDKLSNLNAAQKDSARKAAQTATSITSINFSNVRKVSTGKSPKLHIYSPENVNLTYAFTKNSDHNPIIQSDLSKLHHGEFAYLFPGKSKYIQPFNKIIPQKSKYLKIIRDINFNILPTNLSFRTGMDRQFGETKLRPVSEDELIVPLYNKFFTWDRIHAFKLDLSKGLSTDFNATTNTRIDEPEGLIDTQVEKDSIITNIKDFGRTTNYGHAANAAYTLPLSKFPLLDWTNFTSRYGATFAWLTAPLVLDTPTQRLVPSPLGNTISNTQNITGNADLNFRNLYNKSKFLKKYDTNASSSAGKGGGGKQQPKDEPKNEENAGDHKEVKKNSKDDKKIGPEAFFIRLPLMLKRVTFNYTETHTTVLPGYLPKPKWGGQDLNLKAPGWDFIFGYQPDSNWVNAAAKRGWISNDTALNYQFVQNSSQNISSKVNLEPAKDVGIELTFMRNKTQNLSEYFKVSDANSGFQHLSRAEFGTFTMSFISLQTAFEPLKANQFSQTFRNFEAYRETISNRWADANPYSNGAFGDTLANFRDGYGPYSQDVLIPAFLAAYTNKDPKSVKLALPFNAIPFPNWRISYNGLTKLPWAKKIWTNVNLSHGYTSTLTFGSYTSSLDFEGSLIDGIRIPSAEDPTSHNFITFYDVPSIGINESFSPLLGIDLTWKNTLTTKIEFNKSRNLSFSMYDYQLTEARTSEISGAVGYKFKHVPIPFKIKGKWKKLKNDVNFLCNVAYSDNVTLSERLDQELAAQATSGIKTIEISPSADYTVNSKLNIRLNFEKRFTIPYVSTSYPINYTSGGVTIRFTLAQ